MLTRKRFEHLANDKRPLGCGYKMLALSGIKSGYILSWVNQIFGSKYVDCTNIVRAGLDSAATLPKLTTSIEEPFMIPEPNRVFRLGDRVRIKAGPFASFTGRIEGINQSKSLLKVAVEIFGRRSAVAVNFQEAEKLQFEPPEPPLTGLN